jgi:uncharacterized membrane protein
MLQVEAAKLTFHGFLSPWVAGALALAAAVGIFALYAREHGKISPARRALMALLRVGVVGTALFLLCRPVLLAESRGERPRGIALLLDDSLSMTQKDQRLSVADRFRVAIAEDRVAPDAPVSDALAASDVPPETSENPSRASLIRSVLAHPRLKLAETLERRGPLEVYLFGQRLRRVEPPEDDAAPPPSPRAPARRAAEVAATSLKNAETRTALADAIHDLLARNEGDLPAAIVVVTDGQDNASKRTLAEAARECERAGVPLHLWGVGSSEVGNLTLKDFAAADTIFYDDTVSVPVRWRCRGFKQGAAEITVSLGPRVVARKEVPLREGEDFREVLTFTPQKNGAGEEKTELAVAVVYKGTETLTEDNVLRRPVSVVDRKVKILYVENSPRWEYKFLQPALLRDRRVEGRFVLTAGDKRTLASGPPYLPAFPATRPELFAFDVLILGDVPAAALGGEKIGWIRDFVREGGSLIVIAGRQHTPSGYASTPLSEVLPVEVPPGRPPSAESDRPQPYVPVLTRQGERAEMLALADTPEENARIWQTLPGFYGFTPAARLRPGAVALLVHPRHKVNDQPLPVLATHYYGKGQVFFLGTDETWRWRSNVENKYFGRFWGQVIYQMGLPHLIGTPKRVQLSLERPENFLGRPGHVYARVFDVEFRPFAGERILARLEPLDVKPGEARARSISLDPVAGQAGEYRALLAHDALGRFALKVDEPSPASIEFRVDLPPQHELEVAGMDEPLLREAAAASGGAFYREEDLHRLGANLAPKKAAVTSRQEVLLWNAPMLLLFVGLVLAEWLLRKFSNLS